MSPIFFCLNKNARFSEETILIKTAKIIREAKSMSPTNQLYIALMVPMSRLQTISGKKFAAIEHCNY